MTINVEEIKNKIISFLGEKGPSLPVTLASAVQLTPIFTSAILAELSSEKQIKTSSMKIGASPLYFLPGQETLLENFIDNLNGVEYTAFQKLKQSKILQDELQEPAIRVAIHSLKDFAIPFKFQDKLYWKYFTTTNDELQNLLIKNIKIAKIPQQTPPAQKPEKPLLELKKTKKQKQSQFIEQVKSFLIKKDIELLKEISTDKKEIISKIRINSEFGKLIFLLIAKDKKRISEADITLAYQKAIEQKMPCYFLSKGELSKKTSEFLEDYKNIIKIEKLN